MSFFFIDEVEQGPSGAYVGSATSATPSSAFNFTSQAIGSAAANRYVIVGITHGGTGSGSVSSVTIGGVAATLYANVENGAASQWQGTCLAIAAVPTGATGTIVVNTSVTRARCSIDVSAVFGLNSAVPVSSGSDVDGSNPQTVTLTTQSGGYAFAIAAERTPGSYEWSGLSEDSDYQYDASNRTTSAASALTDGSSISVSSTFSTSVSKPSLSAASWR